MNQNSRHVLGAKDILAAQDVVTERVDVPEWDGVVLVRSLTGTERDWLEQQIVAVGNNGRTQLRDGGLRNFRARLVGLSLIDEDGNRLFTDDQVDALGQKNAAVLERLFAVCQRLSGLSPADVEELTKN